jgi:hypothetical protein
MKLESRLFPEHQEYTFIQLEKHLKEVYCRTLYTPGIKIKIKNDVEAWVGRLVKQGDLSERMKDSTIKFLMSIITIEI